MGGLLVLPIVIDTWTQVCSDTNRSINWMISSYDHSVTTSHETITVSKMGCGGLEVCSLEILRNKPSFGGFQLKNRKFVTFFHVPESISTVEKGKAIMHKNYILNKLNGVIGEIDRIWPGMPEQE